MPILQEKILYEDRGIRIEVEPNELPWLKVFTQHPYREMSQAPQEIRYRIYELLHMIEEEMLVYYRPDKINIASFGNYLPQVHWHIMARFKTDSYFPEPAWGEKQRDGMLDLPSSDIFHDRIKARIQEKGL